MAPTHTTGQSQQTLSTKDHIHLLLIHTDKWRLAALVLSSTPSDMPPLHHRPSESPQNPSQSSPPLPPFFASRPTLSNSSSNSSSTSSSSASSASTSDSSLDHTFRQLTLQEAQRPPSLVYGFKEDEDVPDLQELYSQDAVYYTEKAMLQRRDSWDARTRENATGHSSSPASSPRPSTRPFLPHRNSSFSKRHASLNSPREVPLPYMPSRLPDYCNSPSHTQDNDQPRRPVLVLRSYNLPHHDNDNASSENYSHGVTSASASSSCQQSSDFKPSNTTSVPHSVGMEDAPSSPSASVSQRTQRATTGPVTPFSRPFSSPDSGVLSPQPVRAAELGDRLSTASLPLPMHTPYHALPPLPGQTNAEGEANAQDHVMEDSSSSLGLRSSLIGNAEAGPSRGWGLSLSNDAGRSTSPRMSPTRHSPRRSNRSPAPQVFGDWTQYTDEALLAANAAASASHARSGTHHPHHPYARLSRRPMSPPASIHSAHSAHSYPPPTPPTILTPPPPEERDPSTPYVPFLSHGQPSEETYIAVETLADEYRLHVRLPGYRRDAITLSTRKRRILHLVADSWEPEGGHFERRIVFGYDADLSQVRAEFDGEMLRVFIQRRLWPPPPMTYWSSARD